MRHLVLKLKKYISLAKKFSQNRLRYKILLKFYKNNNDILSIYRLNYYYLSQISNNSFLRIKFRCLSTNYNRSYRKFFVSRIVLRELASSGKILGIRKSS